MVAKAAGLLSLSFLFLGCSNFHISPVPVTAKAELRTRWVKPTQDIPALGSFRAHRKINRMTPVLVDDYVLQGNNINDLVLLDRKTSRVIWRKTFEGGVEAGAIVFKNRIYVPANDGTVSALDLKTGETIWKFTTSSENVSSPVLDTETGYLYFQNAQNIVFCLDAETGRQVWLYSKVDNSLLTIRGAATPLVHKGTVYVGFSEGSFVALKAATGQLIWEQILNRNERFRDIDAKAVPYKNAVIVSGYDDKVYSLNAETGKVLWTYNAGSYSAATVESEQVYVSTTDSRILKLHGDTGEKVWSLESLQGLPTQIVPFKSFIIFGESGGDLKVVDAQDGRLVARFEPGRGIYSKPAVDEARPSILFISGESNLYNMDLNLNVTNPFPYIP